jgi:hypothetical protein
MVSPRLVAAAALAAVVALPAAASADRSSFLGWMPILTMRVGTACARGGCTTPVGFPRRYPTFALGTDAPRGATVVGTLELTCGDGSKRTAYLPSPAPFAPATMGNPCPNWHARSAVLTVTSATAVGVDEKEGFALDLYGSMN